MASKRGPKPFMPLRNMGVDRMQQLETLVIQNMSAIKIAQVIQNEWGELTHMNFHSLRRMIGRYKKHIQDSRILKAAPATRPPAAMDGRKANGKSEPPAEVSEVDETGEDPYKRVTFQRYLQKDQIDLLREYEEIYLMQRDRVSKLWERELKTPLLLLSLREEMKLLNSSLNNLKETMIDLGAVKRVPRRMVLEGSVNLGVEEKQGMKLSQEAQQQALSALSGLNEVFEGEFSEVSPLDDEDILDHGTDDSVED